MIKNSPNSSIKAFSLPDGEKASSVVCCDHFVVVISMKGRFFQSEVQRESCNLKFTAVEELADEEIVGMSGIDSNIFAVSKKGQVFGRGSNDHGQLDSGKGSFSCSSFTEIKSLGKYISYFV